MQRHINTDDRSVIASILRAGYMRKDIAKTLGFTKGAISKEIKRNIDEDGVYRAHSARIKTRERRKHSKVKYRKISNNPEFIKKIETELDPLVSPEVVAHILGIHHQTIYSWVYRERKDLLGRLPQRGRKRRRYGSKRAKKQGWTQKVKSIHDKPKESMFWEGDTIKGRTRSRVLTHVEYTSLYLKADLIHPGREARTRIPTEDSAECFQRSLILIPLRTNNCKRWFIK